MRRLLKEQSLLLTGLLKNEKKQTIIHEERREYEESSIGSTPGCGIGSSPEPAGCGFCSLGQLMRVDPHWTLLVYGRSCRETEPARRVAISSPFFGQEESVKAFLSRPRPVPKTKEIPPL